MLVAEAHRAKSPPESARRSFFKQTLALVLGGLATGVPALAGLGVLLDPLRRKTEAGEFVRVGNLESLPTDGQPRKFSVLARRVDAWNKFPNVPVGAVYLRRTAETAVQAYNAICPHAGCFVDFLAERGNFFCPCHNSSFALDGSINDPKSPSPRGMDSLEVEVRNEGEIWVRFQNFRAGLHAKVPEA
jgi:menaquinol-cytochrome c reductase iron-sulfur subunit